MTTTSQRTRKLQGISNNRPHGPSRAAFTLIELLVVIAIIGVLVALLLPAVQSVREAGRRMQCANHLKQIGLAIQNYANQFGYLPPATVRKGLDTGSNEWADGAINSNMTTWIVALLPYLEQQAIYDKVDFEVRNPYPANNINRQLMNQRLPGVRCPSDDLNAKPLPDYQPTNYVANSGRPESTLPFKSIGYPDNNQEGPFHVVMVPRNNQAIIGMKPLAKIRDGLTKTVLISECMVGTPYQFSAAGNASQFNDCKQGLIAAPANPAPSARGASWFYGQNCEYWGFNTVLPPNDWATADQECKGWSYVCSSAARSWHPGGVTVAAADGSTHFIADDIDLDVWQAYGTIDGKEVVTDISGL